MCGFDDLRRELRREILDKSPVPRRSSIDAPRYPRHSRRTSHDRIIPLSYEEPRAARQRSFPQSLPAVHEPPSRHSRRASLGNIQSTRAVGRPGLQQVRRNSSSQNRVRQRFVVVKKLNGADRGAFNQGVYLVHDKFDSRKLYVEKRMKEKDVLDQHAWREVRALQSCSHPNIVALIGAEVQDLSVGYGSIYMEYCELGSFAPCIRRFGQQRASMSEGFLWSVFFDLSLALTYLQTGRDATSHAREGVITRQKWDWSVILHRDIKPDNIFFTWKNASSYPRAILGDFGCSLKETHAEEHKAGHRVSRCHPRFTAPETPRCSTAADVYSLGLTLSCGARVTALPIEGLAQQHPIPSYYSNDLQALVRVCTKTHPADRPRTGELAALVYQSRKAAQRSRRYTSSLPSWAFS